MPTIVTNTIGTTGDYTTLAAWEAACPANLVTADQVWRGECLNEEFVSSSTFGSIAGMTTDSTRYVELTAAAGASFVDHADRLTNPLRYDASKGAAFRMTGFYTAILSVDAPYTRVSRLQFYGTQGNNYGVSFAVDGRVDQVIHASAGGSASCGPRCTWTNVLSIMLRNSSSNAFVVNSVSFAASYFYNCIGVRPSDYTSGGNAFQTSYNNLEIKNCAVFGFATFASVAAGSASGNNNATNLASVGFGTSNQASLTFADQIEEPDATTGLDCRTKAGAALIDNGADLSGSGVTTDIVGTARGATYDIGVWEYAAAGVTVALTGTAATAAVGTLGVSRTTAITGVAGTSAAGTISPSLALALTGVEGIADVGDVGIGGDKTVALTGVDATGEVGDVAVAVPSGAAGPSRTRRGARRVYLPEPQASAVFHPNALPEDLAPHAVKAWQDDEDDEWFLLA